MFNKSIGSATLLLSMYIAKLIFKFKKLINNFLKKVKGGRFLNEENDEKLY